MGLFGQVADKVALDFILDEGDPLRRVRAAVLLTMPKILRGINQIDYSIIVTSDKDRGTYQLRSTTAICIERVMGIARVRLPSEREPFFVLSEAVLVIVIERFVHSLNRSWGCPMKWIFENGIARGVARVAPSPPNPLLPPAGEGEKDSMVKLASGSSRPVDRLHRSQTTGG